MMYPRKLFKLLKGLVQNRILLLDYALPLPSVGTSSTVLNSDFEVLCNQSMMTIRQILQLIVTHVDDLKDIPLVKPSSVSAVYWKNNFLPGLDVVGIYAIIRWLKPSKIIEIGSGNSTAVMRKAIVDGGLKTSITCIDPDPRRDISTLADHWVRKPLEQLQDISIFETLTRGDVVFFDGSHYVFSNSDVLIFLTKILSKIPAGVYVQMHDIYLPYDYPQEMIERGYNEQYLLAQTMLHHPNLEVLFPAYWVSRQPELAEYLEAQFWSSINQQQYIERHGGSFWFKIKES